MKPTLIATAQKLEKLYKRLNALKSRKNKINVLFEILSLETYVSSLLATPAARVKLMTNEFNSLPLDVMNTVININSSGVFTEESRRCRLRSIKNLYTDKKITDYFYLSYLVYSTL